jgi:hypothetical protein
VVLVPATITSPAAAVFTVGTATGFPVATLSESGAPPRGLTFIDNGNGTALLSGKPTAKGTLTFTTRASNGLLPAATQTFRLTVD